MVEDGLDSLTGHEFTDVRRHGKFLIFDTDDSRVMVVNSMLTGRFQWAEPGERRRRGSELGRAARIRGLRDALSHRRPTRARAGSGVGTQEVVVAGSAFDEVHAIVRRIPRGRVMNYGQIAELLSRALSARAVGWAMQDCPEGVPWQRVVNAAGGISTEHLVDPPDLQRRLLESEGVRFDENGKLSMARYRFTPRKKTKKK